ncbi:MAG TPA: hypothetical protein VGK73_23970 [Polyangiaceae bacterium]
MTRPNLEATVLALALSLGGCAGSTPAAGSVSGTRMTPAEAREYIAEVQAERGTKPGAEAAVGSMDELFQVVEGDEIGRFEQASRLVAGKPGIDAQSLHATIELLWSDALSTVALLAEELGEHARIEAERLTRLRDSGRELGADENQALERAQKSVAFHAKARDALDVLAVDHLRSTVTLVNELLRNAPEDPRSYRVAALYYLLSGDWQHYDSAMTWLKPSEATDAGVQYLRGMEALKRFAVRKEATAFFKEALRLNPKLVRAQAKLVLAEESIDAKYAELQTLTSVAPRHPIVSIAGPSITSEYEMALAVRKAREAHPSAQP